MKPFARWLGLLALVGASVGVSAVARAGDGAGDPAPAFIVRAVDGRTLKMAELKGRPVVLDFWATWCGPCRASMPHLNDIQRRYADKGLVVVGLSVDDAAAPDVRRFAERLGVQFRIAMADEKVLDQFGPIRAIPTTIFINRRGVIVRRLVGALDAETLDGYVRELF